jgi:hypothetical protein
MLGSGRCAVPKRVKPVKVPLADGLYWTWEAGETYWTDKAGCVRACVSRLKDGLWDLGTGDIIPDAEGIVHVVGERLTPPACTKAPDWQARYDAQIEALKAAGEDDPLGGEAFLYGYYWVSVIGEAEPVIALFSEGSWIRAGHERDLPELGIEIIDGPFMGPLVQVADPSEDNRPQVG